MSSMLLVVVVFVSAIATVFPTTLLAMATDACVAATRESCFDAATPSSCQWCPTDVAANRAGFCQPLGSVCNTIAALDSCPSSTTNETCLWTSTTNCGWCSLPSAAPGGRQCLFTTNGPRPSQCVNGTWTQPMYACSRYTAQGSASCRSERYCGWCGASSTCLWSDGPQPSDCASEWGFAAPGTLAALATTSRIVLLIIIVPTASCCCCCGLAVCWIDTRC